MSNRFILDAIWESTDAIVRAVCARAKTQKNLGCSEQLLSLDVYGHSVRRTRRVWQCQHQGHRGDHARLVLDAKIATS